MINVSILISLNAYCFRYVDYVDDYDNDGDIKE